MAKALITGIAGQDGSYLADFLIGRGYEVHGLVRPTSRIDAYNNLEGMRVEVWFGDVADPTSIENVCQQVQPDEIYNLAAMSFVPDSWRAPHQCFSVNTLGVLNILETVAARHPNAKVYQASTSEMFGDADNTASRQLTTRSPMTPRSPYGISKLAAHRMVDAYRRERGIFACSGILFNHESPRRGLMFLSRKVARFFAAQVAGLDTSRLMLGALTAVRDFGYAPEYVRAMHAMLQRENPGDFVVATGIGTTVADFVRYFAVAAADMTGGEIEHFMGLIDFDETLKRPNEVPMVIGDPGPALVTLGWVPKTTAKEIARIMLETEVERLTWRKD